jgi:hypothetical protein
MKTLIEIISRGRVWTFWILSGKLLFTMKVKNTAHCQKVSGSICTCWVTDTLTVKVTFFLWSEEQSVRLNGAKTVFTIKKKPWSMKDSGHVSDSEKACIDTNLCKWYGCRIFSFIYVII